MRQLSVFIGLGEDGRTGGGRVGRKREEEEFQTSVTPWQKNVNPMRNPNSLRSCRTGASTIVAETFGGRADPELNSGLHAAIWVVMNCVVFFLIEC